MTNFIPAYLFLNAFATFLFCLSLIKKKKGRFTYSTIFILSLTIISLVNSMFINIGVSSDPYLLPSLCVFVLAAEWLYVPNIFHKVLVFNSLALLPLMLLGGLGTYAGRIHTPYLTAYTRDIFYLLGFCSVVYLLLHKRIDKILGITVLVVSSLMIALSGSRKDFLFILLTLIAFYPVLLQSLNKLNKFKKLFVITVFGISGVVMLVNLVSSQLQRFGRDNLSEVVNSTDEEASALERFDYIETGFRIANFYPLGIGEKNMVNGIKKYGGEYCKEIYNVHSLIAQVLFMGGYLGLFMLIILALRLVKLSFVDIRQYFPLPLFFLLMIFTGPMFLTKMIWPVMVFYEKDIVLLRKQKKMGVVNAKKLQGSMSIQNA